MSDLDILLVIVYLEVAPVPAGAVVRAQVTPSLPEEKKI